MTRMQLGGFLELVENGHYRLGHRWQNMKGDSFSNHQSPTHWWPEIGATGLPIYHTKRCGSRGCWACQHRARRRLRDKVGKFIDNVVYKNLRKWKFVTLTLPGDWYEIRRATLEEQFARVRKAFRSWRTKMKRRDKLVSGFYTIELTSNQDSGNWHAHVHMIMPWKKADYNSVRRMWVESVDRPMRRALSEWTEDKFTNDSRTLQVDAITDRGIAEYLTKVTNYVTKVPNDVVNPTEVAKVLYKRRTTGWLGDYYVSKKNQNTGTATTVV